MIINSEIISVTTQLDGTRSVHEQHTASNGTKYDFTYFATDEMNVDLILQDRAENLNRDLQQREQAKLQAGNFKINLSKLEFLRRFTAEERIAIRTRGKTNPIIEDFLAMLDLAESINIADLDTINAVHYLRSLNDIATDARVMEILS